MTEEAGVVRGDDETAALSVEERLVRLERISLRYHSLLDDGDALSASVRKLGVTAESLASSLAQVDKNQRLLMGVRSDVDTLKDADSPSRAESETESTRLDAQLRLRVKTIAFSAVVILVVSGLGVLIYTKARNASDAKTAALSMQVCQERGSQANAMRTFIKTWEANVMASSINAKYKAEMTIAFKKMLNGYAPVDCSVLIK